VVTRPLAPDDAVARIALRRYRSAVPRLSEASGR
jgi:hypothetical protein